MFNLIFTLRTDGSGKTRCHKGIIDMICENANHPGRLFAVGDQGTILRKENLSDWEIVEQSNFENL